VRRTAGWCDEQCAPAREQCKRGSAVRTFGPPPSRQRLACCALLSPQNKVELTLSGARSVPLSPPIVNPPGQAGSTRAARTTHSRSSPTTSNHTRSAHGHPPGHTSGACWLGGGGVEMTGSERRPTYEDPKRNNTITYADVSPHPHMRSHVIQGRRKRVAAE
jgi:hypothetical protein